MFGSMQNWWEGAKKVVKGTEPDSDSEGTEGPDSNESSEKVLTPETENTPQVPSPTENLNKNTAEIGTGVTNTETSSVPKLGQPEKKENISSLLDDLENGNSMSANIQKDMEEVSTKAISTAKNWGSYLLGFGKASVSQVANTAKKLKDTVEEKTIIGEFNKEQEKFVTETKEKKNKTEASVPPWVGYNEEDTMKSQILALSQDKRNFLRNPPAGVQFNFDFTSSFPVAMSMLAEDPGLEKMRFELVPKQLKEETFWRNYFYRVSLIKQSAQLSSLAQQTDPMEMVSKSKKSAPKEEDIPTGASPPDHEFISDAFMDSQINEDDLRKEMQQLGMSNSAGDEGNTGTREDATDDIPEWEKELQAELQEYEVVDDGSALDDADLEKEILQQIEAEANQS